MRHLPILIVIFAFAAACSPRLQTLGDAPTSPHLTDNPAFVSDDGRELPLRIWRASGNEKAVALAIHGFNDYSRAFEAPATWWATQGITTYAFDQRGFGKTAQHGIWPGAERLKDDVVAMTRLLRARHPGTPLYLVGVSMGGAVALLALADKEMPRVDGAVLSAPAVWGWRTMNPFYRTGLWLGAHIMPGNKVSGRDLGIRPSDNVEMLRALGRDPLVIKETRIDAVYGVVSLMDRALEVAGKVKTPLLVLYGKNDEIIPRAPMKRMLDAFTAPYRLLHYPDGWHMLFRDLQGETVWKDVAAWMFTAGGVLPSGQEVREVPPQG